MTSFRSVSHDASGLPATANGQRQWRFGYSAPVVSNTYATWNPADKAADIGLSNGDLTFSHSGGSWSSVRANQGKNSGKWYFEINPTESAGYIIVGVASSSAGLGTFMGADEHAWTYYGLNGNKISAGVLSAYGITCTNGDVIGIAVNFDAMTMTIYINGASQGAIDISSLTGATLFPAASCYISQLNYATANFGASAFTYAPPAGYNSGWYE